MKTLGTYDAIVIGVGGMGSATVYELASRGMRVLGLERFSVPNDSGSSHGVNRIIRLAYYEDSSYVPLLKRSYERWRELEKTSGEKLLYITGSVDTGSEDSRVFTGSLRSCREHNLPHEALTSAELTQRFPGFRFPDNWMGVYQPDGGFVLSERSIVNHVFVALERGGEVRAHEAVLDWSSTGDAVRVRTSRGLYEAGALVVTAGAWAGPHVAVVGATCWSPNARSSAGSSRYAQTSSPLAAARSSSAISRKGTTTPSPCSASLGTRSASSTI